MPWKELSIMDQKVFFISDWLREPNLPFSHLCQRYDISRKTGYKWVKRYQETGIDGLHDQSRKPQKSPFQVPLKIRQQILTLRTESSITPGAKKIRAQLATQYPDIQVPSVTTIYKILREKGLIVTPRKRRPYHRYMKPLTKSSYPNQLWSVDFKGQFKLANGKWCYPLTLMDDHSRFLLGCEGQYSVGATVTIKTFKHLFKTYGLPERIRSDNGVPFATKAAGGISRLSAWWIQLGIHPERIEPGKPQQNGRHERMHRTLKKYGIKPPSPTMREQQKKFDQFKHAFNEERPHESLALKVPAQCYEGSKRAYPLRINKPEYPSYFDTRKVGNVGTINWLGYRIYTTHFLKDEYVGIEAIDEGVYAIYYYHYQLGKVDVRNVSTKSVKYLTLKV